jgi:hypothetical protein
LAASYGDTQNPYASKTANYVLAAPNGSAGVPTFRAIVAADIPTLNQNTTGTASNVTGTVAIANGGTGQTTASTAFNALSPITSVGDLIIGSGVNNATRLGIGANGYVLTSNGTTASWAASTGGVTSFSGGSTGLTPNTATTGAISLAGTLAVANGGTGITSFGTGVATALGQNVSGSGSIVLGTSPTVNNPTVTNYVESVVVIGTVTSSNTISLTNGTVQTATLTASTACTFTMPTATAGKSFVLLLKQAASTGNGTATFSLVKWGSAGAPTITATAGRMDILTFFADGTNWYGSITQGYTP